MAKKPPTRLDAIKTAIAPDGSEVCFSLRRADGTTAEISLLLRDLPDFILGLEAQAAGAQKMLADSLRGVDRRLISPIRKRTATKIQGAVSRDGPILTLELDGRLLLDVTLKDVQVTALIEFLQGLQSASAKPPPKAN